MAGSNGANGTYPLLAPRALDGEVASRARTALANSPIHVLRNIAVERRKNTIVLSGRVDSFYHKQVAQEVVRHVAAECELVNGIDVG